MIYYLILLTVIGTQISTGQHSPASMITGTLPFAEQLLLSAVKL
jgi:hypothetical protein